MVEKENGPDPYIDDLREDIFEILEYTKKHEKTHKEYNMQKADCKGLNLLGRFRKKNNEGFWGSTGTAMVNRMPAKSFPWRVLALQR
jgi:hypothetical protein